MIFKKISELSLESAVALWNLGFEGYVLSNKLMLDQFLTRAVSEGLSFEHSLAMYDDEMQPVGLVMNGFRTIEGRKIAWNGGTGIAPAFRGKGLGKQLMERNLELYREQGVDAAMLEALTQNETAISLYQKVGYRTTGRLVSLEHDGALNGEIIKSTNAYTVKRGRPVDVFKLSFYNPMSAWQTQWTSMKNGESILVFDKETIVGFALCKRGYDENGNLTMIVLYQCEAAPERLDKREILQAALSEVFAPCDKAIKRLSLNIRHSNQELHDLLISIDFVPFAEQVHMLKQL